MGHTKLQTSMQAIFMLCKNWSITKQSNLTNPGCCWYVIRGPHINKSKAINKWFMCELDS